MKRMLRSTRTQCPEVIQKEPEVEITACITVTIRLDNICVCVLLKIKNKCWHAWVYCYQCPSVNGRTASLKYYEYLIWCMHRKIFLEMYYKYRGTIIGLHVSSIHNWDRKQNSRYHMLMMAY